MSLFSSASEMKFFGRIGQAADVASVPEPQKPNSRPERKVDDRLEGWYDLIFLDSRTYDSAINIKQACLILRSN